eukprot:352197-Chlamydomonas_euryale.AAC.1
MYLRARSACRQALASAGTRALHQAVGSGQHGEAQPTSPTRGCRTLRQAVGNRRYNATGGTMQRDPRAQHTHDFLYPARVAPQLPVQ